MSNNDGARKHNPFPWPLEPVFWTRPVVKVSITELWVQRRGMLRITTAFRPTATNKVCATVLRFFANATEFVPSESAATTFLSRARVDED